MDMTQYCVCWHSNVLPAWVEYPIIGFVLTLLFAILGRISYSYKHTHTYYKSWFDLIVFLLYIKFAYIDNLYGLYNLYGFYVLTLLFALLGYISYSFKHTHTYYKSWFDLIVFLPYIKFAYIYIFYILYSLIITPFITISEIY